MFTPEANIGEVINYLRKSKNTSVDKNLINEVDNIIDLSMIRIEKYGVIKTFTSLKNELFNLRILLSNNETLFNEIFEDINSKIKYRIEKQYNTSTKYHQLELAFVNGLSVYGEVVENMLNNLPIANVAETQLQYTSASRSIPNFNYESFVGFMKKLPGGNSIPILNFLDNSLALDFSIFISELIFDNSLKVKKQHLTDLTALLKNSTEEYALAAYELGEWKPREENESQCMRNIKIRISLEETTKNSQKYSLAELNTILNQ